MPHDPWVPETTPEQQARAAAGVTPAMYATMTQVLAMTSADNQQAIKALAAIKRILNGEILLHHPPTPIGLFSTL